MDNHAIFPPGELISADGTRYHVRHWGEARNSPKPALLLETGLTMMSSCWGWLAPALGERRQVIAYDRAGLGWSDEREGLRDAPQIARELNGLTKALGLPQPFVLLGHSMGAMFNRAFHHLNPAAIAAMIWLDPAHPDQLPRSRRMRSFFFMLEFAHLLARRNLPSITIRIVPQLRGLPESDFHAMKHFLKDPRHLQTCAREARAWNLSADLVRNVPLGNLPLLILSAQKHALRGWTNYQKNLAGLSSRTRHLTFTDMSHLSMISHREHASRVAAEIDGFLETLKL